ncbi:uncharacterized protein LOC143021615 [Oratosquilla oratoria]|uniref:uncharacterized protein LOC143021615 n=1 Tax=Oratosquilla oratoria TaxID=337810 RepID=UPI003F76959F
MSLLPYDSNLSHHLRPTVVPLTNASGTRIRTYGEIDVELGIQRIRRSFPWSFVVDDAVRPILGTYFLITKSLIIDCKNGYLLDPSTGCTIPLKTSDVTTLLHAVHYGDIDSRAIALLSEFPVLTAPMQVSKSQQLEGTIYHRIDAGDFPPVLFKARPLIGEKLKVAKEEFQYLFITQRLFDVPTHLGRLYFI